MQEEVIQRYCTSQRDYNNDFKISILAEAMQALSQEGALSWFYAAEADGAIQFLCVGY